MCKAKKDGGQRCATHTRPDYLDAIAPAFQQSNLTFDQQIILGAAAVPYATTIKGHHAIKEHLMYFITNGQLDVASVLRVALQEGAKQRAVTKEIEAIIEAGEQGANLGARIMTSAKEQGIDNWTAYQYACEAATAARENFYVPIAEGDNVPEGQRRSNVLADTLYRSILASALEIYNQSATVEEVNQTLIDRSSQIIEELNLNIEDEPDSSGDLED